MPRKTPDELSPELSPFSPPLSIALLLFSPASFALSAYFIHRHFQRVNRWLYIFGSAGKIFIIPWNLWGRCLVAFLRADWTWVKFANSSFETDHCRSELLVVGDSFQLYWLTYSLWSTHLLDEFHEFKIKLRNVLGQNAFLSYKCDCKAWNCRFFSNYRGFK